MLTLESRGGNIINKTKQKKKKKKILNLGDFHITRRQAPTPSLDTKQCGAE